MKILKITTHLIALGFIALQSLSAQDATAHMSIFNAVESEKRLLIDWGTINAFPDGIPAGQSFGPVIVPAGSVAITAKVEEFVNGKSSQSLPASTTCAYIVWPGEFEEKEPQPGQEKKRKLEITALPPVPLSLPSSPANWTLIYTGLLEEVSVKFNGKPQLLKRGKATTPGRANEITITQGEKELASQSVEGGNYAIVIFGDDPENLKTGVIYR